MTMKRRLFLKGSLAAGAVGMAVGAGLLMPGTLLATWNKTAFEAKSLEEAMKAAGIDGAEDSADIKIKAPSLAENGAEVLVTVSASMADVSQIAILAAANNQPLNSTYELGKGAQPYVSTRIKMGESGDVIAIVKAGGKVFTSRKTVRVTIGGCGG